MILGVFPTLKNSDSIPGRLYLYSIPTQISASNVAPDRCTVYLKFKDLLSKFKYFLTCLFVCLSVWGFFFCWFVGFDLGLGYGFFFLTLLRHHNALKGGNYFQDCPAFSSQYHKFQEQIEGSASKPLLKSRQPFLGG